MFMTSEQLATYTMIVILIAVGAFLLSQLEWPPPGCAQQYREPPPPKEKEKNSVFDRCVRDWVDSLHRADTRTAEEKARHVAELVKIFKNGATPEEIEKKIETESELHVQNLYACQSNYHPGHTHPHYFIISERDMKKSQMEKLALEIYNQEREGYFYESGAHSSDLDIDTYLNTCSIHLSDDCDEQVTEDDRELGTVHS